MREILFRGKRLNGDGWVCGDLSYHVHDGEVYVFPSDGYDSPDCYEVYPDTIGQYTGLTDKNGVKIFEGDIIQRKGYIYPLGKQEPCGERIVRGSVIWMDDGRNAGCWCIDSKDEHGNPTTYSFDNSFIVVGNIHDNPELLK